MLKKLIQGTAAVAFTVASLNAVSGEAGQYNIHFAVGQYIADKENEDSLFSIAGGYFLSDKWSVEGSFLTVDVDSDFNHLRLDGLYHLEDWGQWSPYALAGLTYSELDLGNSTDKDAKLNLGGGIEYFFTETLSWRTEGRLAYSLVDDHPDVLVSTGVNILFGNAGPAKPKKVKKPSQKDSDNDGIMDLNDACSSTPVNVMVDVRGCPVDIDRDGVADYQDDCLNTSVGAKVNARGCYITLTENKEVNLDVKFPNNSSILDSSYYSEIEKVADFMRQYPLTKVVIEGHSDSRGKDSYNLFLSDRRANSVAEVLVNEFGIAQDRVTAKGFGEVRPIASNETAEGRAKNRRVVAVVSATVEKIAE